MKRRLLLPGAAISALAALTVTVAACGGGSSSPAPTVPAGALEVDAGPGLQLNKAEYTIAATAGSVTIAYLNKDTQRHTLVVKDSSGVIQGTKLEVPKHNAISVGTFQLAPGKYTIYCDVPGHGSMKATLTVS